MRAETKRAVVRFGVAGAYQFAAAARARRED